MLEFCGTVEKLTTGAQVPISAPLSPGIWYPCNLCLKYVYGNPWTAPTFDFIDCLHTGDFHHIDLISNYLFFYSVLV